MCSKHFQKPILCKAMLAAAGRKRRSQSTILKFESSLFEHIKVLQVLASAAGDDFQFFILEQ
jgi:hypothetical protein